MTYHDERDEYREAIKTLDQLNSDAVPDKAELLRRIERLEYRIAVLEDRVEGNPHDPEVLRRALPRRIAIVAIFTILWLIMALAIL